MTVNTSVIFDFNKFFPSIEEILLEGPLSFAIVIPSDEKSRIRQHQSFLFLNIEATWIIEKQNCFTFELAAFNRVELSKLVINFLPHKLWKKLEGGYWFILGRWVSFHKRKWNSILEIKKAYPHWEYATKRLSSNQI